MHDRRHHSQDVQRYGEVVHREIQGLHRSVLPKMRSLIYLVWDIGVKLCIVVSL